MFLVQLYLNATAYYFPIQKFADQHYFSPKHYEAFAVQRVIPEDSLNYNFIRHEHYAPSVHTVFGPESEVKFP